MGLLYKNKLIDLKYIKNKDVESIKKFFRYNGINKFDSNDIESLKKITDNIDNTYGFNVSYCIERLDKEFDLIKIGNKKIANIELKLSERDEEQCIENYKILNKFYSDWEIDIFCYESKSNILYKYDKECHILEKSEFKTLNNKLNNINIPIIMTTNFDVTSVYASPEYYIEKKYSLSKSQLQIKRKIIEAPDDEKTILVSGRAGTGKTLLALDLYSYYENMGKKVTFIAPFKMNDLVNTNLLKKINMRTSKWFIINPNENDILIVDEAQRLDKEHFIGLKKYAKEHIIFLGDINQRLEYRSYFLDLYQRKKYICHNLNQVIRSDDTFDVYAKKVLNISTRGIKGKQVDFNKVKIFMSYEKLPDLSEYVFIEPAKSKYYYSCDQNCSNPVCKKVGYECSNFKNAYDIIGQEYSKVAMCMCNGYYIDNDQIKTINGICYANLDNQLYTIMTRAIEELIIIVDNIEIYNYLCSKKELLY